MAITIKKESAVKPVKRVAIKPLSIGSVTVPIRGTSMLVVHNWSYKAKLEILEKQKKQKKPKEIRDPWMDFCESLHWITDKPYDHTRLPVAGDKTYPTKEDIKRAKFGFPAIGIKKAMVTACSATALSKVAARQAFFITPDLIEVISDTPPVMREDPVRIGQGTADLRYRGCWENWTMMVNVDFNLHLVTAESIVNLLHQAGWSVGIGEHRPEKSCGNWGRFEIIQGEEELDEEPPKKKKGAKK